MIYLRSLIFNILAYSILLFGCAFTCLIGLFVPKKWIWALWNDGLLVLSRNLLKYICDLEIEIRGRENIVNGGAIYASKHQSAMETYYLTSYLKNATFIFKKELAHVPFFGWAVRLYGSVPVAINSGLFWEKRSFLRHPGKIVFEFLPPMPRGLDKKTFLTELQNRIEIKCDALNRESLHDFLHAKKIFEKYSSL